MPLSTLFCGFRRTVDSGDVKGDEEPRLERIESIANRVVVPLDLKECTGFGDLPDELLEGIFRFLLSTSTSRRNHFAVCGVSRSWRRLGRKVFFSSPWDSPHLICHPNQLFCLSPRTPHGSRSGLLKCFVRREPQKIGSGRHFTLWLGKDHLQMHRARFLFSALQFGNRKTFFYLSKICKGPPCAVMESNFTSSKFELSLNDGTVFLLDRSSEDSIDTPAARVDTRDCTMPCSVCSAVAAEVDDADSTPPSRNECFSRMPARESCEAAGSAKYGVAEMGIGSVRATTMPQALGTLQYRSRMKGFLQPRRMEIFLPNPSQLASPRSLPLLKNSVPDAIPRATSFESAPRLCSECNRATSSTGGEGQTMSEIVGEEACCSLSNTTSSIQSSDTDFCSNRRINLARNESTSTVVLSSRSMLLGGGAENERGEERSQCVGCSSRVERTEAHISCEELGEGDAALLDLERGSPLEDSPMQADAASSVSSIFRDLASVVRRSQQVSLPLIGRATRRQTTPVDDDSMAFILKNKSPHWNEGMRCWCLNFRGRVKLASVKNFQLVRQNDPNEKVIMQFGKVDANAFILDFNPTMLSAVQSFAISLTTFPGKFLG